jgi:eukaryotic-like serine/threonine-protein kinase
MAWTRGGPTEREGGPTARSTSAGSASLRDADLWLTTLDGRYRIIERIASGGMGEVFRAHDAVLDREVAIKVLHRSLAGDADFIDRFRREARAAAVLNHPNIAGVYDWGAVDGIYYMTMEFVRGESVREILAARGRLLPAQAADVLIQVLGALEHAHRHGIVHRDVKPENVIVTPDGVAKVADFGLARAYADATATRAGAVTGTVQYLAPEQIRGEPADPRTDLYSVGILAYELVTGRLPFTGETSMAIAYKHLSERVPPPSRLIPDLPRGLDGFILSATERDRELRPESAGEMRRDLRDEAGQLPMAPPVAGLVDEQPPSPPPSDDPDRADTITIERPQARAARRSRRRSIVGRVVLASLLVGATLWASWTYLVPHKVPVPNVVGRTVRAASADLVDLGLRVGVRQGVYSLKVDAGSVVRSDPGAGADLRAGDRVVLIPSLGPPPVPVPDVTGMSIPRARRALSAAGLALGDRTRAFDATVPAGGILRQRPGDGVSIPQTSHVAVVVSKGPPPVAVPSVVAVARATAERSLRSAGLVPSVTERFSDGVPLGAVISQSPAADAELPQGSTVSLVVSKGPESFPLPALKGMTRAQALSTLSGAGLHARVVVLPHAHGDRVVSQDPAPERTVHAGATVTIYLA